MKSLVTGGGGFLGSRIAQMLSARGDEVTVLGRNRYPHHEDAGLETIQADIRDATAVSSASEGKDVVFHVAALAALWGPKKLFHDINVEGTRHVLEGCHRHGVGKLVFTSSPSVVFGRDDLCGVDESQPYPDRYLAHYPETKARAERMVLEANGPGLATVALRPHLIWGPGDPHLIPRVVDRARRGQLAQVGDGRNLVDITYIDNAAEAHVLAADALSPRARCAGRAYFISQGEPVRLWPWLNDILSQVDAPTVEKRISFRSAYAIGTVLEAAHRLVGSAKEPRMTRFLSTQLAKSHYFNISSSGRDFGYRPRVTTAKAVPRLIAYLRGEMESPPEATTSARPHASEGGN